MATDVPHMIAVPAKSSAKRSNPFYYYCYYYYLTRKAGSGANSSTNLLLLAKVDDISVHIQCILGYYVVMVLSMSSD